MRDEDVDLAHAAADPTAALEFEVLYRRERAGLLALAQALCRGSQPWAAEDIVQETFVRAYERWDRIADYERPDLWLRRVAVNLATSRFRRFQTAVRRMHALAPAQASEPELSTDAAWVLSALRRLPRRQAEVLALRFVDDLTIVEIAEVLGMAEGTVRTHLGRGRDALRRDPHVIAEIRSVPSD